MLIDMLKKIVEKEISFPQVKGRIEFDVQADRREDVLSWIFLAMVNQILFYTM